MPNQALEQTRDSVLRYGEPVGRELLNFVVLSQRTKNMKPVYLVAACIAMSLLVFATANAVAGTVVVVTTICILVWLAVRGFKDNKGGLFYGGVSGLAWLAFALGFAFDVPSDRRIPAIGGKPHPLAQAQMWIVSCYQPIARTVPRDESIYEFRSFMDGSFKKPGVQLIPSPASFSRLVVSIIALIVATVVAALGARRNSRGMAGPSPALGEA